MRNTVRATTLMVLVATCTILIAGCVGFGPTGQERADQLAAELESGNFGVREATANYTGSISSTMVLRVTLDDSDDEWGDVSAETLRPILETIARGTEDMRLGSMDLFTKDPEGQDVSLASAARELGLEDAVRGESLGLLQSDLRDFREWLPFWFGVIPVTSATPLPTSGTAPGTPRPVERPTSPEASPAFRPR